MTIGGWILFVCAVICIGATAIGCFVMFEGAGAKAISLVIAIALIIGTFFGIKWYFNNTASGQRALVDQKSELNGGIDRTVTVYTANGDIIASYSGKIDIEGNDGGYVLFDFEGKRYMYYNCFVESIAEIEE